MESHATPTAVILGLDPRIHDFGDTWMVGSSPTMTKRRFETFVGNSKARSRSAPCYFESAENHQPIDIRLALPPAAVVLIEVETSSSSQLRQ